MIILASTSAKIQVTTGTAKTIDVHASWVDWSTTALAGCTNTAITTATTTDVVAPPAASTQRNVKTLHIRNKDATSCDVTVKHTDGTTNVELLKLTLQAGDQLQYVDGLGFLLL